MNDIHHRIGITAPKAEVHRVFATTEGLASWWTLDTEGDATEGGKLVFTFGDRGTVTVEVVEVTEDRVQWRGVAGPDEWTGTTFTFDLSQDGDETVLRFTHGGWREQPEFFGHCTTKWGSFLLGAKALLEGGEAAPYPGDLHISSWD